jgi:type VI secretion system protein ImpL
MELLTVFQPFLKGRAIAAMVAVMLLLPIIYLFGPMIDIGGFRPLESDINRMIVCAVLFLLTLVIIWVVERRKSRRDLLLVAGIAAPDPSADRAAEKRARCAIG